MIPDFDERKNGMPSLRLRGPRLAVTAFAFAGRVEGLHQGVIETVSLATHTDLNAPLSQKRLSLPNWYIGYPDPNDAAMPPQAGVAPVPCVRP